MGKLPLSVSIITYNEEDIIGETLSAVKDIANEIVVVDSGSTDRTVEIAKNLGAKVYIEEWKGYSAQKNSALEKCTQEWILSLDADEVLSEELKKSIIAELENPRADGYLINRRTYYMGKFLKYTWQPEWRLRLVKKSANPIWVEEPHDYMRIDSGKVAKLKGDLYHYSYRSFLDHAHKAINLGRLTAVSKYREGKRCGAINIALNPLWAFFKSYLFKGGFLDGYAGFVASFMSMVYTFFKYAFLYELQLKEKRGKELWHR